MSVFDDSVGIEPGSGIILDHVRRARMALIDPLAVVAGSPESSVLVGQIEEALNRLRSTECDGAAFLAAECLALARLLPALPSVRRREAAGVLGIGLDQVADLAGGGGAEPAHGRTWELAQMLNELRAARGRPLVSESAVFTPGLAGAIAADGGAQALGDIGIADAVGRERMVFHRGMVLWYGEGDVERGLRKLRRVARNLARAAGSAAVRRLFFVLEALFIGIADDTVFAGVAVRHLLADVDQLLRRLARDGESAVTADFPGGLLRNLLFYVA